MFAKDASAGQHDGVTDDGQPIPLAYCVVANVAAETAQGEGGLEVRSGLKHFAPGAKVWVLPPHWGDGGDSVIVVGHHRRAAGRYVRIVIPRRHLTNYRVGCIYSPALLRALTEPSRKAPQRRPQLWKGRDEVQQIVSVWRRPVLEARFDDHPFSAEVEDPPPMELQHRGKTYYLAHFNTRRALYSSQLPPTERTVAAE
jgi:hypothetical protein